MEGLGRFDVDSGGRPAELFPLPPRTAKRQAGVRANPAVVEGGVAREPTSAGSSSQTWDAAALIYYRISVSIMPGGRIARELNGSRADLSQEWPA